MNPVMKLQLEVSVCSGVYFVEGPISSSTGGSCAIMWRCGSNVELLAPCQYRAQADGLRGGDDGAGRVMERGE
jgi:hypothetical protein